MSCVIHVLCYLLHFHKVPPLKLIYFMIEIMPLGGWGVQRGRVSPPYINVLNICLAMLDRHAVSTFRVADCGLGDG